jgi:hypothetical protein
MKLDISRAGPTKWMKPGRLDVDGEMHSRHGIRTLLFHEAIHNSQYVCSPTELVPLVEARATVDKSLATLIRDSE